MRVKDVSTIHSEQKVNGVSCSLHSCQCFASNESLINSRNLHVLCSKMKTICCKSNFRRRSAACCEKPIHSFMSQLIWFTGIKDRHLSSGTSAFQQNQLYNEMTVLSEFSLVVLIWFYLREPKNLKSVGMFLRWKTKIFHKYRKYKVVQTSALRILLAMRQKSFQTQLQHFKQVMLSRKRKWCNGKN